MATNFGFFTTLKFLFIKKKMDHTKILKNTLKFLFIKKKILSIEKNVFNRRK